MSEKQNAVVRSQDPKSPPTFLPSEFWLLGSVSSNQFCNLQFTLCVLQIREYCRAMFLPGVTMCLGQRVL